MQVTGMLYGSRMLQFVGFPAAEVLGSDASEDEIKALIERHGSVFIKPVFKGGVGKKGKAGLLGRAKDLKTALKEKERLYFVEHRHGNQFAKANGVTFEGAVSAEHEVYFSLTDSTHFRAPTMTLTHVGGVDIEDLSPGLRRRLVESGQLAASSLGHGTGQAAAGRVTRADASGTSGTQASRFWPEPGPRPG